MSESSIVENLLNESAPIINIRLNMVNADHLADVTFTFPFGNEGGGARSSIKAHKAFLISASPVFFTMFCGSLPPPTNEVAIEDISRDDFMEVLRFVYAETATINSDNVYGVWYAAEKYMLGELTQQCVAFVRAGLKANKYTVLTVFNAVQLFDNHEVDEECMDLMLNLPERFLNATEIVKINQSAFNKLIQRPEIDCSVEFLQEIALEWLNFQKKTKFRVLSDKVKCILKKEFNIQPMHFVTKKKKSIQGLAVHYLDNTTFQEMYYDRVRIETGDELHGVGIYVGVDPTDERSKTENLEWLVVKVRMNDKVELRRKTIRIRQKSTPSILRVMFEKIGIVDDMFITVRFSNNRRRAINPMSLNKKTLCGKLSLSYRATCIAYLIENPNEDVQ